MAKINNIIDGMKRKAALIIFRYGAGYNEGELRVLLIFVRKAEKSLSWLLEGKKTQEA